MEPSENSLPEAEMTAEQLASKMANRERFSHNSERGEIPPLTCEQVTAQLERLDKFAPDTYYLLEQMVRHIDTPDSTRFRHNNDCPAHTPELEQQIRARFSALDQRLEAGPDEASP